MVLTAKRRPKNSSVDLQSFPKQQASVVLTLLPFIGDWLGTIVLPKASKQNPYICYHTTDRVCHVNTVSSLRKVPKHTFLLVFKVDTSYCALVALSHADMEVEMCPSRQGLSLFARSGVSRQSNVQRSALIYSHHANLDTAIANAMELALLEVGSFGQMLCNKPSLPAWMRSISWESDFGLSSNMTHKLIVDSVKALIDSGVPIKYVIIDDGWQSLSKNNALISFQAEPARFPSGLKGLVSDLHKVGVDKVGLSHSIMGAKSGVHRTLAKNYDLPPDSMGRYFLGYDLGRTFEFFCDFYRYIKLQGIAFIKVIDQEEVASFCREGMDVTTIYQYLQEAIQAASSLQFNSAHMNADCLTPANLFYWSTSQIARSSKELDLSRSEYIGKYFRDSLLNSLWLRHLMVPDFGSWMTKTPYSYPLGMFHALSGCLHSLADLLGDVDRNLLNKLIVTSGNLARSDHFLTLTKECLFMDPLNDKGIYKAYLLTKFHGNLWVTNLHKDERGIVGYVSPSDVEGLSGDVFCAYSFKNHFMGIVSCDEKVRSKLKPYQADVWTFAKVHKGISVLGMPRFFLMSAFIQSMNLDENYLHLTTTVYAPILIYSERKILEVRCNGEVIPWNYDTDKQLLMIDEEGGLRECLSEYSVYFE